MKDVRGIDELKDLGSGKSAPSDIARLYRTRNLLKASWVPNQ